MMKLLHGCTLLIGAILFFTSCNKESQKEIDDELIVNYIANNGIDATKTDSGLYYQILVEGDGDSPDITNDVEVTYTGRLLDGTVFDTNENSDPNVFPFYKLILGWQEGLQLMKEGGEALLIIPSHLGYGSQAVSGIPANSVLVFNVELLSVQ